MFGSFAEDGLVKAIDTCRLFEDSFDFWDETGDGWSILEYMLLHICSQPTIREAEQLLALFSWITQSFIADIKANYSTRKVQRMAYFSEDRVADTVESLLRLSPPEVLNEPKMINFEHAPLVHRHIISQNWKLVNLLLAYGADPHRVSSNSCKSGNAETPLSLAMYSSWAFWTFRNILHERSFDLEEFARQELQEGHPLFDAGWQMETLTALLEPDFEPDIGPYKEFGEIYYCDNCGGSVYSYHIQVQPYWRGVLESIRNGTYPPRSCLDTQNEQLSINQNHLTISDKDSLIHTTEGSESSNDGALLEDEAAQSDEESPTSGSDNPRTLFARDEVWCTVCWFYFKKTGRRWTPASPKTQSSDEDDSSDDDFSPYLFNT